MMKSLLDDLLKYGIPLAVALLALDSGGARADVQCITQRLDLDSWVNTCNADIVFTHTACNGGVNKVTLLAEAKPRYSADLAQKNHEKNCIPLILSECVVEDIKKGICKIVLENPLE